MNIDISDLEQALVVVYQKNLTFLKENFFDIFEKVEQLSLDINEQKYKEKYSLELCDGYFDILNLENNGYYYAANSYTDGEKRASYVDFSNNSSFDLLRKQGTTQKLSMPYGLGEVLPVVDFINEKVDLEHIEFQKIVKFIYFGVGLGYHIQEIDKKVKSYTTLIMEPELEIFRLSLFTTDYTLFDDGSRKLFLCISDDKVERDNALSDFYNYHNYMNYNIKHYTLLKNLEYIKVEAIEFFKNNFVASFPYSAIIENVRRTVGFIREKDRFLVVNEIQKKDIFKNKKILLVSAGPSLDHYIDTIKRYQDKFVVVCVDVIVKKLEKHNIIPDIVFSIDPSYLCADFLTTEDPDYLKNSIIILLSQQHEDVMKILRERKLQYYFSQSSPMIKDIGFLGSVPNVGTFSFQIMVHLGAKEMYLIGNDAAFDQETGSRYSKDSSYTQMELLDAKQENEHLISDEDIIEMKGNLRDIVKTNRSLLDFKYSYDTSIAHLNIYYKYKAYNLSDGVFIDGLNPMKKDKFIENAEKNKSKKLDLKKDFDSISKVLDTSCYKEDIKIINSIIQRAKKFQKNKITSRDDFLTQKLDMMIWILEKSKELSIDVYGHIFLQYTSLVDSYINFAINLRQKDLYTKENLETLSRYWAKGVISVFKDMKDSVSE